MLRCLCRNSCHLLEPAFLDYFCFVNPVDRFHRGGPWRSLEAVEYATLEWVDWFNNRRLLGSISNVPPAEAEADYYANLEELMIAA